MSWSFLLGGEKKIALLLCQAKGHGRLVASKTMCPQVGHFMIGEGGDVDFHIQHRKQVHMFSKKQYLTG